MIDVIATYHENPLTCGVAKFNRILGNRLGVPVVGLFDPSLLRYRRPLLSIKCSEFTDHDLSRLHDLLPLFPSGTEISLFLHGFNDSLTEFELIDRSHTTYCGNGEIYQKLKPLAKNVVKLWSPGTLKPASANKPIGEITVFSFGMAHKLRAHHYFKLRRLLDQTGRSYTVFLSTALHDGTSFEESFSLSFDQLSEIFDDNIRFLGFLSDDAVLDYLRQSTFFAAFFDQGVRENNSSVIAAMENGCVILTNIDNYSPAFIEHGASVLDIDRLEVLPVDQEVLRAISERASTVVRKLSWPDLIAHLAASWDSNCG